MAASSPLDIKIVGRAIIPENIASAEDGAIYVGGYESGAIYRAGAGEPTALPWVKAGQPDAERILGLWVDHRADQLLVCAVRKPPIGETKPRSSSIRVFGLDDAKLRTDYSLEAGGICNDITVAADGTIYTTDMAGRIFRRRQREAQFSLWFEDTDRLMGADGLALMADGSLLIGSIRQATLNRIAIAPSGAAAGLTAIVLDQPLKEPDGMRRVSSDRFLVAESGGRLTELTIANDGATTRIIRDGIAENPSGVTLVGGVAYVSLANWAARRNPSADKGEFTVLAIPYRE